MRKRYYIIFVAREKDGRLRKVPVPLHYAYIFVAAAVVGAFTIAGMAGSYSRMLLKTAGFNQVRSEHAALRKDYRRLQVVAQQNEVQAASLGSLASEVTALYGLRHDHASYLAADAIGDASPLAAPGSTFSVADYTRSLDQLSTLRDTALSGQLSQAYALGINPVTSHGNWLNLLHAPMLWPVTGPITSSFGERTNPFGEGDEFHPGIDIGVPYGTPVRATANGVVIKASLGDGYGREVEVNDGNSIVTVFGHLSGFAVIAGERVHIGEVIGYVGSSGRSTGPHLHYEVRVHNVPVNPYKYLRETMAQFTAAGGNATGYGA